MDCRCGKQMELVGVWDSGNPGPGEYAFNLYLCDCGIVVKDDVWTNAGALWICLDGTTERVTEL